VTAAGRRRLGTATLACLVVANMVGAGLFTTSGFALADLGSPGRVLAAWAVGGAIAILGALCYGALAAHLQESGGEYLFLSRTVHPAAGFLAGWISLLAGFGGAIAFAAEAMQSYLAPWFPAWLPPDLVGSAVIITAGVLHAGGLKPGVVAQNGAVIVKLVLLLALAGWGLGAIAGREVLPQSAPPTFRLGAFAATLMWISLSYSGWNAAVYVAGEVRDPRRSVPRSMLLGTLLVTALYLALNTVFLYAAPAAQLAGRPDVAAAAAEALGGPALRDTLRILMALAMLTSVASMTMVGPRVYAKMADDGLLPRALAFAGEVPRAAIALQVVVALLFLWLSGLREQLANLGWLLGLCTAAAVIGLLRLRRRLGAEAVPVPGYPWVPLAFVVATLFLAVMLVVEQGADLGPAAAVLVSGAVAWRFARAQYRRAVDSGP
jgi:APA family basic amino acid/polyamine antiporter